MAEARSAVTVISQYDVTVDADSYGLHVELKEDAVVVSFAIPHPRDIRKAAVKAGFRLKRLFIKGIHPSSMEIFAVVVAMVVARVLTAPASSWWRNGWAANILWDAYHLFPLNRYFPFYFKIVVLSILGGALGFFFLMFVQRFILQMMYSYKGYLYQSPGKAPPLTLMAWFTAIKLLSPVTKNPLTYQFQGALPRLPVPDLKDTTDRLLLSVKPLLSETEYEEMQQKAREFLVSTGPKLQRLLYLKYLVSTNYVSDWWEKYVYLRGRSPIAINSNYYVLDRTIKGTSVQTARAAQLVWNMLSFKKLLDREEVPPILMQKIIPLCMNQYWRMFSTTRIPKLDIDQLKHFPDSKHIVVHSNGHWYKVSIENKGGNRVSAADLQVIFEAIIKDSASAAASEDEGVAALTSEDRAVWAAARERYLVHGLNKKSLAVIEEAVMILCFDENEPESCSSSPGIFFHGNGRDRWFDKSVSLVVCKNAVAGMNIEHSWADAPVIAHLWEYTLVHEELQGYDDKGNVRGYEASLKSVSETLRLPLRLQWELSESCKSLIRNSILHAKALIADIDVLVACHDSYGKGYIKKCKVSPDAFVQMALQLAWYRQQGSFTLTYESSMTRLYLNGRTETIRSCSLESVAFVKAMNDENSTPAERLSLLQTAAAKHQHTTRLAMSSKGVDRHLFALYVAASGLGIESPFLNSALSMPFKLSTSQQPQEQTAVWNLLKQAGLDKEKCRSPGGGFGPVADDGYGVSYMVVGDDKIFFHVSSKKSCTKTDSKVFLDALFQAFADMRKLLG